jgi:hypothetical protein
MNKERLLKLANHLLTGELGHEYFEFSHFNHGKHHDPKKVEIRCGSRGCALGECPIVFPEDWMFTLYDYKKEYSSFPVLSIGRRKDTFVDAMIFFDINDHETQVLFNPYMTSFVLRIDGVIIRTLSKFASKEEVANQLIEFVKLKEDEQRKIAQTS